MTAPSIRSRFLSYVSGHPPREGESTAASPPPAAPTSNAPSASQLLHLMMYGHARVELTYLTRPDGVVARQLVLSVGLPPVGRLASRMTLNDLTGRPTAIHGEIILGSKPLSVGASIGRSQREILVTWFKRYQPSIMTTNREVTRFIVREGGAEVQRMGELKLYGRSLSTLEIGRAHTYQFSREHYREARAIMEREGSAEAAAFLRQHYPHVDEGFLRQTLRPVRFSRFAFGAELLLTYGAAWGLSNYLGEGPVRHAAQNGAAYAIGSVFRQGWRGLAPARLSGAVAEALPLVAIHAGLSMAADAAGIRFQGRWLAEDFGSLAIYGFGRAALFPRFLAAAAPALSEAGAVAGPTLASELGIASRFHWVASAALLAGIGIYAATRPAQPRALSWEEFESRYGEAERRRWNLDPVPCEDPWGAGVIAKILDGGSAGPVQREMDAVGPRRLGRAVERITPEQRQSLVDTLGESGLRELLALSQECDRELFWEGLLHLARRMERAENSRGASALRYPILLQNEFPGIRQRARRDLDSYWA